METHFVTVRRYVMRNIFSYDSALMRFLTRLFDIVVLSVTYAICALPVITIGAAQAGLSSGVRAMLEPNGSISPIRAFFKGFASGFAKITIVWFFCLIPIVCVIYIIYGAVVTETQIQFPFLLISCIIAISAMVFQIMATLLHSRFDCKLLDLIKNSWLMVITYPLRTLVMAVFTWAPLLFAIIEPYIFLAYSPVFVFFYYGLSFMLCYYLIRKPFQKIQDIYFPDSNT